MAKGISTLRKIIDDGVSLASSFNDVGSRLAHTASDRLSSAASSTAGNAGRIGAIVLRPIPLAEKLHNLQRMIATGKIAVSTKASMEAIKHEMQKPEHDGLSLTEMVEVLAKKKLLEPVKALAAAFKPKALTLSM